MNLKFLRAAKNKTQNEIAKDLDITQNTYSNYESEKTEPDIETLIKLADYYNVSLDFLCDRQWNNQIGYIPDSKKEVVQLVLQLNEINTAKAIGYIGGLLAGQN